MVRLDPKLVSLGGIAESLLGNLGGEAGRYEADLLLTEHRQRVTYTPGKANSFTIVHTPTDGAIFWDAATRSVAKIPAEVFPPTRIVPSPALAVERQERDGEAVFALSWREEDGARRRQEIVVSMRQDWAEFGPALMRILHCGPACHAESGLPWGDIAGAGLILRERTFDEDERAPMSELVIEDAELVEASDADFAPPRGYRRLETLFRQRPAEPPPAQDKAAREAPAAAVKQALEGEPAISRMALRINERLTPECLGSTRFGSMTASLHQDFLTTAANAVNIAAPLLGSTAIGGGAWVIPWLANLRPTSTTAPGSGIFSILRVPRNASSPPGSAGGGTGLTDRLAYKALYELDSAGTMRTERAFTAGTLAALLASWGVGAPQDANLLAPAAAGNLNRLSLFDQRTITDAYEVSEFGTLTIGGIPTTMAPVGFGSMKLGPVTTPSLFEVGLAGLTGTVNFGSLAGGPLITSATIGNLGNVILGLSLPNTAVTAVITRAVTVWGGIVLVLGSVGLCAAVPFLCPLAATLAALAAFVMTNVTTLTAATAGVTWTLDIRFAFDPATERVEPFVSVLSRTGTVVVTAFAPSPNFIASFVDALVAVLGSILDEWGALLAAQGAKGIQGALREQGFHLPVAGRQNELRAVGGGGESLPSLLLLLSADVRPIDEVASQPFTTQVALTGSSISQGAVRELSFAHQAMRNDLNPQPAGAPGPGPALAVGAFAGLGLSQNVLNYYVFRQWMARRFEIAITDPAVIKQFQLAAPAPLAALLARVTVIRIWPSTPPRIEVAPPLIARGARPLIVYFDDVRACFQQPGLTGNDGEPSGICELACNFKTTGTIELDWPWVFSVRIDPVRPSAVPYEPRSWEVIVPSIPDIMGAVTPADLAVWVDLVAQSMIAPVSAAGIGPPAQPRPWARPFPALQQEVFPAIVPPPSVALPAQQLYLELLARHKVLYALPAVDTTLLEWIDGSGAPTINTFLTSFGAPQPLPTTLAALTSAQAAPLRDIVVPLLGLPAGP